MLLGTFAKERNWIKLCLAELKRWGSTLDRCLTLKKALVVSMGKKDAMFLEWQNIKKKGFGEVDQGQSWGHRYGVITGLPVGECMGLGSWYWTMCGKGELWRRRMQGCEH